VGGALRRPQNDWQKAVKPSSNVVIQPGSKLSRPLGGYFCLIFQILCFPQTQPVCFF